jgi:hypothetical protein
MSCGCTTMAVEAPVGRRPRGRGMHLYSALRTVVRCKDMLCAAHEGVGKNATLLGKNATLLGKNATQLLLVWRFSPVVVWHFSPHRRALAPSPCAPPDRRLHSSFRSSSTPPTSHIHPRTLFSPQLPSAATSTIDLPLTNPVILFKITQLQIMKFG